MFDMALSLNDILIDARAKKASDVHISAHVPITYRQSGQLIYAYAEALDATAINALIKDALIEDVIQQLNATGDVEYVHTIEGHGRYRMALMKQRKGVDITARVITSSIDSFQNSGMPASCEGLTKWAQGMVLVTGPAGCGKSTTLAVLVEMLNLTREDHIITLEAPIEIIYQPKKCQITQREIGKHSQSQHHALRAALREDPDILVVSELRDLNTVQLAISAAETGHLVLGTMNTVNAAQTISRLIDSFPSEDQPIIRNMISESLRGVICQQLVPKKDGSGVVAVYEVLIVNASVANLIREGKIAQINNAITTGKSAGMVLLDQSLQTLVMKGLISKEEALERAMSPQTMAAALTI
jgi:twitching motility protein PilT